MISHADRFDHRAHTHFAWQHIAEGGLASALVQVPAFLRGAAMAAGQPERYHETVTLGYLLLIADRFVDGEPFESFEARNPDLFSAPPILERYWQPETLGSERARQRFVFPDRRP